MSASSNYTGPFTISNLPNPKSLQELNNNLNLSFQQLNRAFSLITGAFSFDGNGNVEVNGTMTWATGLSISDLSLSGTLDVTGAVTFSSTLGVTGVLTTTTDATVGRDLAVTRDATVTRFLTVGAAGGLVVQAGGAIQLGTYTGGIVAQAGYITIKDAAGNNRRLLVG